MDASWAKEFDTELQQAAARKLVDLLRGRQRGERVAVGPGAARLHAVSTRSSTPSTTTRS
jgi:hypothetical protein